MALIECAGCGQTLDIEGGAARCPICNAAVAGSAPAQQKPLAPGTDFRLGEENMAGGGFYESARQAPPAPRYYHQPALPPVRQQEQAKRGVPVAVRIIAVVALMSMIVSSSLGWIDYRDARGQINPIMVTVNVMAYVACALTAAGVNIPRLLRK